MLKRVSGPGVRPVEVQEMKQHLREDADHEDDLIGFYLDAAIDLLDAQGELGRAMIRQEWRLSVPFAPASTHPLWLGLGDALELISVKYRDGTGSLQAIDVTAFEIHCHTESPYVLSDNWPSLGRYPDALQVTFAAGYGETSDDVPAALRMAVKLLAAHLYHNRQMVVVDQKVVRVPDSVDRLIAPYKVLWK